MFVLSAGVLGLPFPQFLAAVALGRSLRYFFCVMLAVLYGEWAKNFFIGNIEIVGLVVVVLISLLVLWVLVLKPGS